MSKNYFKILEGDENVRKIISRFQKTVKMSKNYFIFPEGDKMSENYSMILESDKNVRKLFNDSRRQ